MSMKVKIVIFGSAICYLKDEMWQVIFITDETHPVNFSHDGSAAQIPTLRESGIDRSITLFMDNPVQPKPGFGGKFGGILNMAKDMHGENALQVKRTFEEGREIISMAIPSGILDMDTLTKENYYIQQISRDVLPRQPLDRPVAKSLKIEVNLKEGKGFSMLIQDGKGINNLQFPHAAGTTLNLKFDNDCGQACKTENDFGLYYDWLKDTDGVTKFTAGKMAASKGITIMSEQGNCDPTTVEPPPEIPPVP